MPKPVGEGGPASPKPAGEGGGNTHRSDTRKLATLSNPTEMALPMSGGRPNDSTRISITTRLPTIDIKPVAMLNLANLPNPPNRPNLLSPHVHHSCHTKLCSTAPSTAAAVAGSHGHPAS